MVYCHYPHIIRHTTTSYTTTTTTTSIIFILPSSTRHQQTSETVPEDTGRRTASKHQLITEDRYPAAIQHTRASMAKGRRPGRTQTRRGRGEVAVRHGGRTVSVGDAEPPPVTTSASRRQRVCGTSQRRPVSRAAHPSAPWLLFRFRFFHDERGRRELAR